MKLLSELNRKIRNRLAREEIAQLIAAKDKVIETTIAAKNEEIEGLREQVNEEIEGLREQVNEEIEGLREQLAAYRNELTAYRNSAFESDDFPLRPRILFIGTPASPHTASWFQLLDGSSFNLRLFNPFIFDAAPDENLRVRTYVTTHNRLMSGPLRKPIWVSLEQETEPVLRKHVAQIVREWRPEIIHTMGFFDAGQFFAEARREYNLQGFGKWILQTRGGSDIELNRFIPDMAEKLRAAGLEADQIISDNARNYEYFREWGVTPARLSRIGPVPGSGGLDVDSFMTGTDSPARRNLVLWPKAYNTAYALALPVLEGLRLAWERIPPCRIVMLWAVQRDVRDWIAALPAEIREYCDVRERMPHEQVKDLMRQARVMLAPSLVDGTPNSMFEAMASGALPIVSPLETLKGVVEHETNVLFARNLYPQEIAEALVRGMTDDILVERVRENNRQRVVQLADRSAIRKRVVQLYEELAMEARGLSQANGK